METKSSHWGEEERILMEGSTSEPGAVLLGGEPTLAITTVVGVVIGLLLAIGLMFTLGVLLDCRQQRILQKMNPKRHRVQRRQLRPAAGAAVVGESSGITSHMEEQGVSTPPADFIREIP